MEKTYVIKWKAKLGIVERQGQKLFSRAEAQELAEELNQEHPDFIHEPYCPTAEAHLEPELEKAPAASALICDIEFKPADEFDCPTLALALA